MNAKSSGPCVKEGSGDVPTAATGAAAEEEEGMQDAGKTAALVEGGTTVLARISGRINLARETGGISLARIVHKEMQASLHYRRSQGETQTIIRTRGLGASRSRARSPTSWAELKPQPLNASSSSSPTK